MRHLNLFLIPGITLILLAACDPPARDIPDPNFNPHVLKPGVYVIPPEDIPKIPATLVPSPIEARGKTYMLGTPEPIFSDLAERLRQNKVREAVPTSVLPKANPGIPPNGHFIPLDSLYTTYTESKGKKVPFTWPEWTPATPERNRSFSTFSVAQGLNHGGVATLLEDREGNIWIGTYSGLNVWDGAGFSLLTRKEGLSSTDIKSLLQDRKGNIWIGAYATGISVWNGNNLTLFDKEGGLNGEMVWSLLEDREGNIWIGTDKGLSYWDGTGFTQYTDVKGSVRALLEDQAGRIWVGSHQGLFILGKEGLTHLTTKMGGLPNNNALSLLEDRTGNIWIGTQGSGVVIWNGEDLTSISSAENLPGAIINDLMEDAEGNIWIASGDVGLTKWDNRSFTNYSTDEGLGNNQTLCILQDRYGQIWTGTRGSGVSILKESILISSNEESDILFTSPLPPDSTGDIWMLSTQGLIRWQGDAFLHYTANGLSRNFLTSGVIDHQNRLWISSWGNGIFFLEENRFIRFNTKDGLPDNWVRSLTKDLQGNIWIGMSNGIGMWNGTHFHQLETPEDLGDTQSLLFDKQQRLWFGSVQGGISVWDGQYVRHYGKEEGFGNSEVNDLLQDDRGRIWMSRDDAGLSMWDGAGFTHYTTKEGLVSNTVVGLYQDDQGNMWVATNKGMNILHFTKDDGIITLQTLDFSDGFTGNLTAAQDQTGNIWLGGSSPAVVQANSTSKDSPSPTLYLRSLQLFLTDIDWRKNQKKDQIYPSDEVAYDSVHPFTNLPVNPIFAHDRNQLTFEWVANDQDPRKLQFATLLEGSDQNWSPLINDHKITYQDLRPGKYTFKVRTVNRHGRWSDTAAYPFTIRPPWWLTNWALGFYVLLTGALIWGIIQWRTYALRRQRQLLRQRVAEQTQELRLAKNAAEQANEAKSTFLSTISHELRTPLTSIIGFTKLNKKNLEEKVMPVIMEEEEKGRKAALRIAKNLDVVESEGQRLTNLINELLDLAKIEAGKVEWRMTEVHPAELIERATAATAALFEQKPSLQLTKEVPENLPTITADHDRIIQVLINLISNAVKFTDAGTVTVGAIGRTPHGGQGEALTFQVHDTGSGIPAEYLDKVFERFQQVEDNQAGKPKGTGLGLPICKEIVAHHGGKIWVESEVGKGSTFWVSVPMQQQKPGSH